MTAIPHRTNEDHHHTKIAVANDSPIIKQEPNDKENNGKFAKTIRQMLIIVFNLPCRSNTLGQCNPTNMGVKILIEGNQY